MKIGKLLIALLLPFISLNAQDSVQTFLSVSGTGVEKFLASHPEYDGRGTIALILDTGVDMGIDGLTNTSTGETKVIDVQDFSGEGDINLYGCKTTEENGKAYFFNEEKNYKIAGADKLTLKALDDKYYIGVIEESKFKNSSSGAEDLNGNGSVKDKYFVVAFLTKADGDTCWTAYFDTNCNGDLSDEHPVRNYKEKFDSFRIPNEKGLPQLTFAINIFPETKKISLHFDDGAHGTHVAGIVSGWHIGGTYLNGVAPGAKIISLKIGNNNFAGGATVTGSMKNAFLYADKISKDKKEPCIINMSFGIGSEIEGRSDMEMFLDSLLKNNPYLYVCLSNGNDGPAISTAGLPASSEYVISSGAALAKEVGRDLYGTTLDRDIILYFSSRGGEVSKPDICSPGACTSTIPNWAGNDRFWGTSMASPYTAGVVSLLLSSAEKEYPGVKIPSQLLFKAIRNGGVSMEGYSHIDQGGGYINVVNAYNLLKKYIDGGEIKNFETYSVSSFAPNMPDARGRNLYLRNGNSLTGDETFGYNIKRNNFQKSDKFYRIYNIKSDSDWLIPIQKKTYIRNNQTAAVSVKIDKSKLNAPGLYTGKITGVRDDKTKTDEFDLLATVVIPYQFNEPNGYSLNLMNESVDKGMIKRYFLELPAGQTCMRVNLSAIKKQYARCRYRLFDQNGAEVEISPLLNSQNEAAAVGNSYYYLTPGVYELDVEGFLQADKISFYNLAVEFYGINRVDNAKLDELNNKIDIVNLYNKSGSYNLTGKILGYQSESSVILKSSGEFTLPFMLMKKESSKEFKINLSKEDFNKVTDFSMIIYDKDGKAIEKNGLSYRNGSIRIDNNFKPDSVSLTLALVPAFTNQPDELRVNLQTVTMFDTPQPFSVKDNKRNNSVPYPEIQRTLECSMQKDRPGIPNNSIRFGKIYFESSATKKVDCEIPILFNF